jgi:cell division inhibitor SulA
MKEEEDEQMLDCGNLCAQVWMVRVTRSTRKQLSNALQVSHMEALLHRPSSTE